MVRSMGNRFADGVAVNKQPKVATDLREADLAKGIEQIAVAHCVKAHG